MNLFKFSHFIHIKRSSHIDENLIPNLRFNTVLLEFFKIFEHFFSFFWHIHCFLFLSE